MNICLAILAVKGKNKLLEVKRANCDSEKKKTNRLKSNMQIVIVKGKNKLLEVKHANCVKQWKEKN